MLVSKNFIAAHGQPIPAAKKEVHQNRHRDRRGAEQHQKETRNPFRNLDPSDHPFSASPKATADRIARNPSIQKPLDRVAFPSAVAFGLPLNGLTSISSSAFAKYAVQRFRERFAGVQSARNRSDCARSPLETH